MFDIGLPEIAITGVVALVVLGPKELPGLLRFAGQLTRKAKNMAHEFRLSLDEMVEVDELEEFRREAWKKATVAETPALPKTEPPNQPSEAGKGPDPL
jgi:sec-independent protein translocase protein TatB